MTREEAIRRLKEARNTIQPFRYVNEALDYAIKALEQTKWIPISEELPEKYTYTLWCSLGGNVQSDYFNGEFWEDAEKYGYEVIAWMPLPELYKESEEV